MTGDQAGEPVGASGMSTPCVSCGSTAVTIGYSMPTHYKCGACQHSWYAEDGIPQMTAEEARKKRPGYKEL